MKDFLLKLQDGETFGEQDMQTCIGQMMEGAYTDTQIAAFLMGLSVRGETVDELCGAAKALRQKAIHIHAPQNAVDCCGTGGDHSGTYNISTAVALVAAACGVTVAKHGNRASSSKSGTADVLEALGVNLNTPKENLEAALTQLNFAFLMAPKHHEAMKYVARPRKEMGVRTIFNLLGPLANPAQTKLQLLGVFDKKWVLPMTQVLQKLGSEKAWVVHGSDGLDEITVTGKTYVAKLENGNITESVLEPSAFGLAISKSDDLKGGDATENAKALRDVLAGRKNAYRDIILANTAAVLVIRDMTNDLKEAVRIAALAIDDGKALKVLKDYAAYTQIHGQKAG